MGNMYIRNSLVLLRQHAQTVSALQFTPFCILQWVQFSSAPMMIALALFSQVSTTPTMNLLMMAFHAAFYT